MLLYIVFKRVCLTEIAFVKMQGKKKKEVIDLETIEMKTIEMVHWNGGIIF